MSAPGTVAARVGYYVPAYRRIVDPGVWAQGVLEGMACARARINLIVGWGDVNGVDLARNLTLEGARLAELDFLFMQDSDTYADVAVVPRLVEIAIAERAAVVAVGCPLRRPGQVLNVAPSIEGAVYEAELAGTGMILVDVNRCADVALEYAGPWFARSYDERGAELRTGGDVHFCQVIRKHGERVFVDTTITTNHTELAVKRFSPSPSGATDGDRSNDPGAPITG